MAEIESKSFRQLSTDEGEVRFGEVTKNNVKMAVMIRRLFPNANFQTSQYIALQMSGALDGAIINSAPSLFTVLCGEKPIKTDAEGNFNVRNITENAVAKSEGIGAYIRSENGDIVLSAPNGRIRIMARDIDLIANGNGTTTGYVNVRANSTIDQEAPTINTQAADAIGLAVERNLNLNVPGTFKVSCGNMKVVEGPDVSPVTSPLGSGSNTAEETIKGIVKLIKSIT